MNKRILIIEDDKTFSSVVAEEVRNLGFFPIVVSSGKEALEVAEAEIPSGVILDLTLPDISGLEVLNELKKIKELAYIPVYIMSAQEETKKVNESNITGYLQKPIGRDEIREAIRELSQNTQKLSHLKTHPEGFLLGMDTPSGKKLLKGKKILVVDDDVRNIYVLSSALEEEGAIVIDALDGKKALEKLKKENVDIILMDIMMPEMNGLETIKAIRKNKKLQMIPIIAVTAKAMQEDKEECLKAGANDYLSKPVDYETLVQVVSAWCRKKKDK